MRACLGIDIGAVTTKLAVIDEAGELRASLYLPTEGSPVAAVQRGATEMGRQLPTEIIITGVATTGSARYLAGVIVGADLVKNEITCQAAGSLHYVPEARTVIEMGGQDSKIIILKDGVVTDFGLNTVCAAGTGSFLDHQAHRLHITLDEFARQALSSRHPVRIGGRCTVFAESDMVHKQQTGHQTGDIIYGLCLALARNYLSDVAAGKDIQEPVLFQGGVAFNRGMVRAFREELGREIMVSPHHEITGAVGAALLAGEEMAYSSRDSKFHGFDLSQEKYRVASFACNICPTSCEIEQLFAGDRIVACWGGRCGFWEERLAVPNHNRGI